MNSCNINHSAIVNFWKDKYISQDGVIKTSLDDLNSDDIKVVENIMEPSCWGCGKPLTKCDGMYNEWKSLWDDKYIKSELNKCHIIPKALGGTTVPANLFLMCESCHRESPDTTNLSAFFRWVYDSRKSHIFGEIHPIYMMSMINDELKRRNMPKIDVLLNYFQENQLMDRFNTENISNYLRENINTHGAKYCEKSIVIGITDYLLSIYTPFTKDMIAFPSDSPEALRRKNPKDYASEDFNDITSDNHPPLFERDRNEITNGGVYR